MPTTGDSDDADEKALREAAGWLARHRVGRLDADAFARWRDRTPANALAFCRVLAVWRTDIDPPIAAAPPPHPFRSPCMPSRRAVLRIAATTGIGAALATGVFVAPAYAWHSAATDVGESRRIILPDGSDAELNTDSRLSWRFTATERTLWLERGEVGLNLLGGAAAIVRGGPLPIAISPGRFNLRLHADRVDLLILAGDARIDRAGRRFDVSADDHRGARTLSVAPGNATDRAVSADQVATMTAWRDHAIVFEDVTLGSAVAEYNRYLRRKIVIVDPALGATPVGGRFETDDPTAFLRAVATSLDIRVSPSADAYLLMHRGAGKKTEI